MDGVGFEHVKLFSLSVFVCATMAVLLWRARRFVGWDWGAGCFISAEWFDAVGADSTKLLAKISWLVLSALRAWDVGLDVGDVGGAFLGILLAAACMGAEIGGMPGWGGFLCLWICEP